MKSRSTFSSILPLPRILTGLGMLFLFSVLTSGQEPFAKRIGGPDDWTHRHLIFSDPGTADEAMRKGTYNRWRKIVNDPRYILQREKRNVAATGASKLNNVLPPGDSQQITAENESPKDVTLVSPDKLPRGLARSPLNSLSNVAGEDRPGGAGHLRRREHSLMH